MARPKKSVLPETEVTKQVTKSAKEDIVNTIEIASNINESLPDTPVKPIIRTLVIKEVPDLPPVKPKMQVVSLMTERGNVVTMTRHYAERYVKNNKGSKIL